MFTVASAPKNRGPTVFQKKILRKNTWSTDNKRATWHGILSALNGDRRSTPNVETLTLPRHSGSGGRRLFLTEGGFRNTGLSMTDENNDRS